MHSNVNRPTLTSPGTRAIREPEPAQRTTWNAVLHVTAFGFVLAGLWIMLALSPRVLYADPWRFVARLLTAPWSAAIVAADNGHIEIIPNAIRWIELYRFDANQWLQIATGALLALLTVVLGWDTIRRSGVDRGGRAAACLILAVTIFWAGNERALAHANESVHVYLVLLCLIGGLRYLCFGELRGHRLLAAGLWGVVAAFSFGSGIATFAAFLVVLWVRKVRFSAIVWMAIGGVATAGLYAALLPATQSPSMAMPGPEHVALLTRWLAAPFVYVFWPLLDTTVAAQLPASAGRSLAQALAGSLETHVGILGTLMGTAGCAALAYKTVQARTMSGGTHPLQAMGLGMAWCGLAIGSIVVISRFGYFDQVPGQVVAPRYLPWSSLFWGGLALATLPSMRPSNWRVAIPLAVVLVVLPSQAWMTMLAYRMKHVAETSAVAAATGVLPPSLELGETVPSELSAALPLLRRAGTSVYAWPETRVQDRAVASPRVPAREFHNSPTGNVLGAPGFTVDFQLLADSPCRRLVLVDRGGRAAGIAMRSRNRSWIGWSRRPITSAVALCARARHS